MRPRGQLWIPYVRAIPLASSMDLLLPSLPRGRLQHPMGVPLALSATWTLLTIWVGIVRLILPIITSLRPACPQGLPRRLYQTLLKALRPWQASLANSRLPGTGALLLGVSGATTLQGLPRILARSMREGADSRRWDPIFTPLRLDAVQTFQLALLRLSRRGRLRVHFVEKWSCGATARDTLAGDDPTALSCGILHNQAIGMRLLFARAAFRQRRRRLSGLLVCW